MEGTATRRIESSNFSEVGLVLDYNSHTVSVYLLSPSKTELLVEFMCLAGGVEETEMTHALLGRTLQRY